MAVNLNKYRDILLGAYKDVLNDKTATDWALFGYEGQTNDLKLIGKGDGGLEEMVEDLNSGKIMYAFCRVIDPKTSLPKCVLINWQGEGAPLVRKGTCANHVHSVAGFLAGAHVTINARTEEEVDPELIMASVSKATSAYRFGERSTDTASVNTAVGTTYKRVNPVSEINSQERDKFWEKEEQEEKSRQAQEKKRKQEELLKLEQERKQRELEEAQQREERIRERSRSITQIREAELRAARACDRAETINAELEEREKEELERRGRSEELRRQRSQEAQALIGQRTINARALFEQNSAAGQLNRTNPRRSSATAALPNWPPTQTANKSNIVEKTNSTEKTNGTEKLNNTNQIKENEQATIQEKSNINTIPDPVPNVAQQNGLNQAPPMPDVTEVHQNKQQNQTATTIDRTLEYVPEESTETANWEGVLEEEGLYNSEDMLQARALYDYQAADSTELTFDPGDVITHIEQIDEGWWQGLGPDGTFGLFPANYVELIQ